MKEQNWLVVFGVTIFCILLLLFFGQAQAMEVLPAEKAGKAAAAKVVSDPQERILDLTVSADVRQLMEERGEEGIRLNVCTSSPEKLKAAVNRFQKKYSSDIKHIFKRINCATVRVEETHLPVIGKDIKLVHLLDSLQVDGVATIPENMGLSAEESAVSNPGILGKRQAVSFLRGVGSQNGEDKSGIQPNDPLYPNQHHQKCVDLERAWGRWGFDTPRRKPVVAVLDTGVDRNHKDLKDNLDFFAGYDFVNHDPYADGDDGHGTFVAGIIATGTNNLFGVAGVLNARIIPVKVLDENAQGLWSDIAAGVNYATDLGVDVINMSLGGAGRDSALERACQAAYDAGILVIAASGNGGTEGKKQPAYFKSVIGVAGLEPDCVSWWRHSNWGFGDHQQEGNVELVAPAEDIFSTGMGDSSGPGDGTSFAAPIVAGIAAGYVGVTNWTNEEIRFHMQEHADFDQLDLDFCDDWCQDMYGYGRIDAYPFNDEE